MAVWIAALAAVVVQPLLFLARMAPIFLAPEQELYGLGLFLVAVLATAAAAALLLGVPLFLLLRKLERANWVTLGLVGLLSGVLPFAWSWPAQTRGYSESLTWHGRLVHTYQNGVPTEYAWLIYGENLAWASVHGLVGALVFYAVWRKLRPANGPTKTA